MAEFNERRLANLLLGYEVSILDGEELLDDLKQLTQYQLLILVDDSNTGAAVRETVAIFADFASCVHAEGLDLYFADRQRACGLWGSNDQKLKRAFMATATGSPSLTEKIEVIAKDTALGIEKPVLLFILINTEPHGGFEPFVASIDNLIKGRLSATRFKVVCMATGNCPRLRQQLEEQNCKVVLVDEYERQRDSSDCVLYTRGDWCVQAMLLALSA